MKKKVRELLIAQVNKEFYSAYLYLDFAATFTDKGLAGFANWYTVQAREERDHAMLLVQYLQNNGVRVTYDAIDKPEEYKTENMEVVKAALAHERYITEAINHIYTTAAEDKDYRTTQFLDWFVREQGEEEKNADDLVKRMEVFGADPKSLYMLDQELAGRTYSAPSLEL